VSTLNPIVVLFCVAIAVALAVRPLRVPYAVALVIVGLVLAAGGLVAPPHLTKDLLFSVFLPGLLFEAAFHLDSGVFGRLWLGITGLAIPGVVAAIALTALIVSASLRGLGISPGFTWSTGLVFAALIAATDPVAVTAVFRRLSIPKELLTLIEGESLLNDGTAVVFLSLVLGYVAGETTSGAGLLGQFLLVGGGGVAVGLAVGGTIAALIRRIDDAMIEIALTVIAAYGSFALAEGLHISGVIATVAAGMVCGNDGRRVGMSATTRASLESFWEFVAFALNSMVFLLLGFEVSATALVTSWREILIAYAAVLLTRAIMVFGGWFVARHVWRSRPRLPASWRVVVVWAGLRGALSMVLALALSSSIANRDLIVTMTAGVVLCSLVVQGLTMAPLVKRLGQTVTPPY
jgi:monovalent cation:H+ antiporter, CPA1 family